jgi:hypothetical protein
MVGGTPKTIPTDALDQSGTYMTELCCLTYPASPLIGTVSIVSQVRGLVHSTARETTKKGRALFHSFTGI